MSQVSKNIYITGAEQGSGKSVIMLAMIEMFSGRQKIAVMALQLEDIDIIDPMTSELRQKFAETYFELRRHKGVHYELAFDLMTDVSFFGTMMVHHNLADGMVSGSIHTTQHMIRPAL